MVDDVAILKRFFETYKKPFDLRRVEDLIVFEKHPDLLILKKKGYAVRKVWYTPEFFALDPETEEIVWHHSGRITEAEQTAFYRKFKKNLKIN